VWRSCSQISTSHHSQEKLVAAQCDGVERATLTFCTDMHYPPIFIDVPQSLSQHRSLIVTTVISVQAVTIIVELCTLFWGLLSASSG